MPYALYAKTVGGHYIGELYGGGIVVAVWKVGAVEHGLIASLTDIAAAAAWSNITVTLIGAQSPTDGQANTTAIITQTGHIASAALLCDGYISGGFSDWYLPAEWELNQCYNAALVVNSILPPGDGFQFQDATYWSSSETAGGGDNAYALLFYTGYSNYLAKTSVSSVRAVRKF